MTLDIEAELIMRAERLWLELVRSLPYQGRNNYKQYAKLRHRIEDELAACYLLGKQEEAELAGRFVCVDCFVDTSSAAAGEYYTVSDELWARTGLGPHDGMLCLRRLERRTGHLLSDADFEALRPSDEAWERHLKARAGHTG
jgi:hypothetical protein